MNRTCRRDRSPSPRYCHRLEVGHRGRPARRGIRDFVTFESHVEGARRSIDHAVGVPEAWYDAPTFYLTNPLAPYGPGDEVRVEVDGLGVLGGCVHEPT